MKKILGLFMIFFIALNVSAQEDKSKKILSELSEKAKTFNTIKATFTMTMKPSGGSAETVKGKIYSKGSKFYVETGLDQDIYCDGRTVWNYMKEESTVYKGSKKDIVEDMEIGDPSELFTIWEKDFKSRYMREEAIGENTYDVIRLHPLKPEKVKFHTITLKINKKTKEIGYIIVKSKDASITTYKINTFETNEAISDDHFIWKDKPGVIVEEM